MRYATQPNPHPTLANARHRNGVSCKTVAAYRYDANGHKRWCIDCGTELGEQAWHPDGADVPSRLIGVLIVAAAVVVLALVVLAFVVTGNHLDQSLPVQTPTTYGYPIQMVR